MKVIDLLNKIANGEEVPSKIEYRNKIFVYNKDNQCYIVENYNVYNDLLMVLSNHKGTDLNYEVEILEELKGIPEKLDIGKMLQTKKWKRDKKTWETINSIIDYLESKGE